MVKIGDRYRPRYIDAKKILSHSRVWFLSFVIDKKYSRCVIDKIKKSDIFHDACEEYEE